MSFSSDFMVRLTNEKLRWMFIYFKGINFVKTGNGRVIYRSNFQKLLVPGALR